MGWYRSPQYHINEVVLTSDCLSQHWLTGSLIIDRSDSQRILSLGNQAVQLSGRHTSVHFQL